MKSVIALAVGLLVALAPTGTAFAAPEARHRAGQRVRQLPAQLRGG